MDQAAGARAASWGELRSGGSRRPLLLILFAAAIPILLFSAWVSYVVADQQREASRRQASEAVERVAERVTAELLTTLQAMKTFAALSALDEPDLPGVFREAERLKAAEPLWETVELADREGKQLLNLLRPLGTPLGVTADRDSFDEVLRTGQPVIGGIGPTGPISGKRLVALRTPVLRGNDFRHVLTVSLIPDAVSSILRGAGAPDGWIGAILDGRGNIVARTIAEEFELGRPASAAARAAIASAPQGFYVGRTLEGLEVETVYRTLSHTSGWSVHFGVPRDELDVPVRRSLYLLAAGAVASLILAAALGLLTARDIGQRRRDAEIRSALALKVSEERGALAVEAADLATWRWDPARDEIVGCERCRSLLDLPRLLPNGADWTWSRRRFLDALHPDDRPMLDEALRRSLGEDARLDIEVRALGSGGRVRWLRATGRRLFFGPERTQEFHGVIAHIDAQKRAEAERIDLLRRLAEAQEGEQRRIARELHDGVGQNVTGLSLGLKGLETSLEQLDGAQGAREQVRWLQALTSEIGREIHRSASDLRPAALDDLGLEKAVAALASDWSDRFGLRVELQTVGGAERLPPSTLR